MRSMLAETNETCEPLYQRLTAKYHTKIEQLELKIKDLKKLHEAGLRFWSTQAILVEEKQQLLFLAEQQAL